MPFIGKAICLRNDFIFNFRFLSQDFFNDYPPCEYPEIERKHDRPYAMIYIKINTYAFAIPMRSHIKHKYAFFTDKDNGCGIDFSKAIYISDEKYIDKHTIVHIRPNEFDALLGKDYIIQNKFCKYIERFVKSEESENPNKKRNFQYSTLHYFKNEIDLKSLISDDKKELVTV